MPTSEPGDCLSIQSQSSTFLSPFRSSKCYSCMTLNSDGNRRRPQKKTRTFQGRGAKRCCIDIMPFYHVRRVRIRRRRSSQDSGEGIRYNAPTVNVGVPPGPVTRHPDRSMSFRRLARGERIKMTQLAGVPAFLYDTSRPIDARSPSLRKALP